MTTNRPLRVFLCHSSADKPAVRELYQKLRAEPWIQPWLDEEKLFPGMDWNMEIEKAIEATDVILVCLSNNSITKEGYVQREIRIALDYADYKPEGTLFIIPVRLEECKPPSRLSKWQYADYFQDQQSRGFQRLLKSLKSHAKSLDLVVEVPVMVVESTSKPVDMRPVIETPVSSAALPNKFTFSNGMEFMHVPAGKFLMGDERSIVDIPYDYWIARFPVTNEFYNDYVVVKGIKHPAGSWKKKKDHPVVSISRDNIIEYCHWLNDILEPEIPSWMVFRLPTESEWEKAARGTKGNIYPWGNIFNEKRCNVFSGFYFPGIYVSATTSVKRYSPLGDSPYGCADMSGNVWEWTCSLYEKYPNKNTKNESNGEVTKYVIRGGSFFEDSNSSRSSCRKAASVLDRKDNIGFRLCLAPPVT